MTDIRHYSDQELSLLFLNDEGLYKELMRAVRRTDFTIVKELCDELFIYTEDQLEDLADTFNDELIEYEQE
jgi:hypothetical protein